MFGFVINKLKNSMAKVENGDFDAYGSGFVYSTFFVPPYV